PRLVKSGEQNEPAILAMEPGRLPRGLRPGPFEESIGRHHASPLLERVAKCGPRLDRLRPRVDALGCHAGVFRAALDQAPSGGNHFAVFVLDPDYEMFLHRRDIVARPIIDERVRRDAELGCYRIAVAARDCESSAHQLPAVGAEAADWACLKTRAMSSCASA